MAQIILATQQEYVQEVEVFDVDLSAEEKAAFRSAPEKFLKELIEGEGHKVNGLAIEARLRDGDDGIDTACPERPVLVHFRQGPLSSNWAYVCPHPV
ncbi:hypothetical protein ACPXCS_33635 [Streptomyces sp. DT190]|uniref:hypothetical protein n=1 Tax=unclassified Streptomyces TaxID=2593676 RepID=UPI003CF5DE82